MKKYKRKKNKRIISLIASLLVVILLLGAIGFIAKFTNGFTSDMQTFYLSVDGKDVLSYSSGHVSNTTNPLKVDVKYLSLDDINDYSVKVIPNVNTEENLEFYVNGAKYSLKHEKDLTAGFDIVKEDGFFTITPKGGLTDVLSAVYPDRTINNCDNEIYDNMFVLLVTSYDEACTVRLAFSIFCPVESVTFDKTSIIL